MTGPHTDIRTAAEQLTKSAAEAGMAGAWELVYLTPREIEAAFSAEAARRQQASEQADLIAYLTGRYVMIAFHAPKKYPAAPDGIRRARREMTDDQMRDALIAFAQRRNEHGGS